jgi:uncharacterized protein (DUF58 family)
MSSGRGVLVVLAGLGIWTVARLVGSPGLAVIGIGLLFLPLFSRLATGWGQRLAVERRLSDVRVSPGARVTVELEVENRSRSTTSYLMIEDVVPPSLGRRARLVMTGVPPRNAQRARYTLLARARGSYRLGPVTVDISDPFAISRRRLRFDVEDELLVTPEVEDLRGAADSALGAAGGGSARTKQLVRTGEEFYTMRQYQTGDDLRRIHWPSVARTGELMIRQDESSRRSTALILVDTREGALGRAHDPAFERAVSSAASVGVLLCRSGFSLLLATAGSPAAPVTEDSFLEVLSRAWHEHGHGIASTLSKLRSGTGADTSFVFVGAPPPPSELSSLIRTGTAFGPKLAILVHAVEPGSASPDRRAQIEGRASQARHNLTRAGWDVLVLAPSARLRDVWNARQAIPLASSV